MTLTKSDIAESVGKFNVKEKAARKGRNPATGESMVLDKRRVVSFKASRDLRNVVNSE